MKVCLDIECTTHNEGNPFDSRNYLVSIHAYYDGKSRSYKPTEIGEIQRLIDSSSLLIGFNFKFDLAWLRKIGLNLEYIKVWDVQLGHFYIRHQQAPFPSLDEVAEYYGVPGKIDLVKEYWDKGVQTDEIPWHILCEYGERDVELTYKLYEKQVEILEENKLFRLACQDLLVLHEMEWNGLHYDKEKCLHKAHETQVAIDKLIEKLANIYPDVPINFGSPDQLSAFLYGGTIKETRRELIGFYKSGQKEGQPRYKLEEIKHTLPRLFEPLPKTAKVKDGVFGTAEEILRKLKGKNKWIVQSLLELSKLQKLNETYYEGIPKLNDKMHWPDGTLHPTYNQCRAATGRLSSSRPNGQNLSGECLDIFVSRFSRILQPQQGRMCDALDEVLSTSS